MAIFNSSMNLEFLWLVLVCEHDIIKRNVHETFGTKKLFIYKPPFGFQIVYVFWESP
jgi:hypothetical protein